MRHYEVTVQFDQPVNVSKFDLDGAQPPARHRDRRPRRRLAAHTSDGEPHMRRAPRLSGNLISGGWLPSIGRLPIECADLPGGASSLSDAPLSSRQRR